MLFSFANLAIDFSQDNRNETLNLSHSFIPVEMKGQTFTNNSDYSNMYFVLNKTLNGYGVSSVSPDHNTLALIGYGGSQTTGGFGPTIYLYNLSTNKFTLTLNQHTESVRDTSFSNDSKYVASTSMDATIKIWHTTDGRLIRSLSESSSFDNHIAFIPNTSLVVTANYNSYMIKIWNYTSTNYNTPIFQSNVHSSYIYTLSVSSNGTFMVSGGSDKTIQLWNINDTNHISTWQLLNTTTTIYSSQFSPDNHYLAVTDVGHVYLFDCQNNFSLSATIPGPIDEMIYQVRFIPNSSILLISSSSGRIALYDLLTLQPLSTYSVHSSPSTLVLTTHSIYTAVNNETMFIDLLPIVPPSAPLNLSLENAVTSIELRWDPPSFIGDTAIQKYNIYRSLENDSKFLLLSSVNETTFSDMDIQPGNSYYYEITAVNSLKEGSASKEQYINIPASTSAKNLSTISFGFLGVIMGLPVFLLIGKKKNKLIK